MTTNRLLVLLLSLLLPAIGQAETKYALLVGIDRNNNKMPELKFAENDMKKLAEVFRKYGFKVILMTGTEKGDLQATGKNITAQLDTIAGDFKAGDTLVVAFSGHGITLNKVPYLVPMDGNPNTPDTLLQLSAIYDKMDEAFKGTKVLLVDACRENPQKRSGLGAGSTVRPHSGIVALFSCESDQQSSESDKLQHSLFYHAVLQKLRGEVPGEKKVSALNLATHVSQAMPKLVKEFGVKGQEQRPRNEGELTDVAPLLVLEKVVEGPMTTTTKKPLNADINGDWKNHLEAMRTKGDTRPFLDKFAGQRLKIWKEMAEDGDPKAMILYGDCLEEGKGGVGKDRNEALVWYRKAADKELPRGLALYGTALAFGLAIDPAPREGVRLLKKAADAGDESGLYHLGQCYESKIGVDEKRLDLAADCYRRAADKGDTFSEYAYGQCLLKGEGVPKDREKALNLLERAAEKDHARSVLTLAMHYEGGPDRPRIAASARKYFAQLATLDDPIAFHDLGYALLMGEGVGKDEKTAVEWFQKAARKKNSSSMMALFNCYYEGRGVKRDLEEAVAYLKEAQEARHKNAEGNLNAIKANALKGDPEAIRALKANNIPF